MSCLVEFAQVFQLFFIEGNLGRSRMRILIGEHGWKTGQFQVAILFTSSLLLIINYKCIII